jgi:thioester reductase-like protein
MKKKNKEPIAITGIGCRFPGGSNNPADFWQLLCNGVDAITEIPKDRWNQSSFYSAETGKPGKTYSRWGGFIQDIDKFDAHFFGISTQEANPMDPQQRLLLEVTWEAIEDGGHVLDIAGGSNTGVFVGISTFDYSNIQSTIIDKRPANAYTAIGSTLSIAANRISYCLNFHGPSISVDTACSSSLVGVHLACQSIWTGECRMAVAGGVNCIIMPSNHIAFCSMSALSPDGRCKAFDAEANGFVRSEGAGVIILKPLSEAIKDGDQIYATILATGVNQDGKTQVITMPNKSSQESLVKSTCLDAGISPSEVAYVEAHGTGTAVGDPVEATALGEALGASRSEGEECLIGSVKTNIGHPEAAAGIAGIIKVALMLKHEMIPPSLHFHTPNPSIDFEGLRLRVAQKLEPFRNTIDDGNGSRANRRIAGVNSFGFGGTNAHVILGEAPDSDTREKPIEENFITEEERKLSLLPVSARSPEALKGIADSYIRFLSDDDTGSVYSLQDISYAASTRRNHFEHRLLIIGSSKREISESLQAFLQGETSHRVFTGQPVANPRPVFVFSGQGPQWWAMGRQLFNQEPVFRKKIEECHQILWELGGWSLLDELMADEESSRLHETAIAQPSIFSIQVALSALWKSWGVNPTAVVGHSVGEVSAVHEAGVLDLKDAMRVIYHRGRCMGKADSQGRMLAVGLSAEEASREIAPYCDLISLAAINGPSSITLSGDAESLEAVASNLEKRAVFNRFVPVNYSFHSAYMDPVKDELLESLKGLEPKEASLPIFSTVTGDRATGREFDAEYWWQNVRQTVMFAPAINRLIDQDYTVFIEINAHPALSTSIRQCLKQADKEDDGKVLPSLRRKEDERLSMLGTLGSLYCLGYPVEWNRFYKSKPSCFVRLPQYSWQHASYWNESPYNKEGRLSPLIHPLLVHRLRTPDPRWEVKLDRRLFPYLNDHIIQGHLIFPAAGYVEIALAVANEVFDSVPYVLEEIEFRKALFLPEGEENPILQIKYSPEDLSFSFHSRVGETSKLWTLNAVGKMRSGEITNLAGRKNLQGIMDRCREEVDVDFLYTMVRKAGLHYGPLFQGLKKVQRMDGEAYGEICLPHRLEKEEGNYNIHPTMLDSCFFLIVSTLSQLQDYAGRGVYMPVEIDRVRFYKKAGSRVWGNARLVKDGAKEIEADILVFDEDGEVLIEVKGFRCQAVESTNMRTGLQIEDWLYETHWKLKHLPKSKTFRSESPASDFIPDIRKLGERLQKDAEITCDRLGLKERYKELEPAIKDLGRIYLLEAFDQLGWKPKSGQRVSFVSLAQHMGVVVKYHRLLRLHLGMLEDDGLLCPEGSVSEESWVVASEFSSNTDADETWRSILLRFPAYYPEMALLKKCAQMIAGVMRGEVDALEIFFQDGSLNILDHLYSSSFSLRSSNMIVKQAVSEVVECLPEGRKLRILEVGAGTGGTTSYLLPELPVDRVKYIFTDISNFFFSKAEDKFQDYPFIEYRLLDIEKDPFEQGFESAESFDLIIASDVLHSTSDLKKALLYIKKLLAPGGLFILNELHKVYPNADLSFALTDGWWNFQDHDLRPDYPLLSRGKWYDLLVESGFYGIAAVSDTNGHNDEPGHSVFLAQRPIQMLTKKDVSQIEIPASKDGIPEKWLLFADQGGVAQKLAELLRERGDRCILISHAEQFRRISSDHFEFSPSGVETMRQLLRDVFEDPEQAYRGVVYLWNLDSPDTGELSISDIDKEQELIAYSVMYLTQALCDKTIIKSPPSLVLVTRGAQPAGETIKSLALTQSPVCGLARVIMSELPELRCRAIDLSSEGDKEEVYSLLSELMFNEDNEDQIALRGEARYVQRLVRGSLSANEPGRDRVVLARDYPCRLEASRPGVLDDLVLRPIQRRNPGAGEVEIEVCAAALNFRDVMKALGIYPSDAEDAMLLGDECSGRIVAVGEGVSGFKPGDRVVAIASGCFASFVTTDANLVMHMPNGMSMEEGATVLVVFLTAYYALHYLGQIKKGERILIHAGAGGVGLASIQLAQKAGAEVFATAGSPEKREFLKSMGVRHVMDSRSLEFAEKVMEITGGEGIDIVLNSLAGEAIPKSLSILRPDGRFLEIGKRDIYENSKIGLKPFRNNLSFFAVDLSRILYSDRLKKLVKDLLQLFKADELSPLPYRTFQLGDAVRAFRYMAQAKQIGKVVLSIEEEKIIPAPSPDFSSLHLRDDGTYLVTGGLRGFGLSVAKWMVQCGARHLVLTSRSGASTDEAREAVELLKTQGISVLAAKSDISSEDDLATLMQEITETMPPLRGVVHAAMVLNDCMLLQMDAEKFRAVMAPKAYGAWNLHLQTKDLPLDFFVLFSSMSNVIGNPGQGNYVAANAFLEALAYQRRCQGLPGLAIAWDRIDQVGYLARNKTLSDYMTRMGYGRSLPPDQAHKAMSLLIVNEAVQMSVSQVDWAKWAGDFRIIADSPRYSDLINFEAGSQTGEEAQQIRQKLYSVEQSQRHKVLEEFLCHQIAKVVRTSPKKLDVEKPLNDQGLDSLMAVELLARIETQLGLVLPTGQLMDAPSIAKLSALMLEIIMGSDGGNTQTETRVLADSSTRRIDEIDQDRIASIIKEDEKLGEDIQINGKPLELHKVTDPGVIFLTGSTGFVGAFLLYELLLQTRADIYCLVRGTDESEARDRLVSNLDKYSLIIDRTVLESRIKIIIGDLEKPQMGLSQYLFQMLAEKVDVIYHNAAVINHLATYSQLRSANVFGCLDVLKLAGSYKLKPVYYTSSIAVLSPKGSNNGGVVMESDEPHNTADLTGGYGQSKWVTERIFESARKRGLPVTIYRPGLIIGDVKTGISSEDDLIWKFVKTCIGFGIGPDSKLNLHLTPVDFVSKAIVYLSLRKTSLGKIFHLVNQWETTFHDILTFASSIGYQIEMLSPDLWESEVINTSKKSKENLLLPYITFYPEEKKMELKIYSEFPKVNLENTERGLADSGIICPAIDNQLLEKYFEYFIQSGYLPPPPIYSESADH